MREIVEYTEKIFEDIKHVDEDGHEYWFARELQVVLDYKRWDKFSNVIEAAKITCENSDNVVLDHFSQVGKMVNIGASSSRNIIDYMLSRYACYLIVQNSDPRKEVVALGQTYFAVQTRKQELSEKEYNSLTEDEKRFYQRDLTIKGNYSLNIAARNAGVRNFDKFHNAGYKGLYNGETADDIAKRKGLRYREDILDNMCSEEKANETHYEVGKKVRITIEELGGIMPEDMPTPKKSLKETKRGNKKIVSM